MFLFVFYDENNMKIDLIYWRKQQQTPTTPNTKLYCKTHNCTEIHTGYFNPTMPKTKPTLPNLPILILEHGMDVQYHLQKHVITCNNKNTKNTKNTTNYKMNNLAHTQTLKLPNPVNSFSPIASSR